MKALLTYWIVGCVLVGLSAGLHETRCPQDKYPKGYDIVTGVAVWPAYVTWGLSNSRKPSCDVLP